MGMGRYLPACAENIKSGKVLLELTDPELEAGLGLNHAMHRKKVRLAIEERRPGNPVRYPLLSSLGNSWVANEWLTDIGLTQVFIFSCDFIQKLLFLKCFIEFSIRMLFTPV